MCVYVKTAINVAKQEQEYQKQQRCLYARESTPKLWMLLMHCKKITTKMQ